ncbi:diguanylate cyclase (GGDEF)-like protein [Novosphingobium hassiacum]|uniref:Diguanylate cyclase (GGDEF)-like protein n=1 Tax=Novosphingobium hassiacum TaxID=173676 RepID=A0A7W6EXE9_9SPHN|nr:EAL domain-containing protein [Novosphingobium hassiacum]MBB3861784.1 diguanylate cyclase (GGDEF)-like protein [Novosphingobium hassiacum]
MDGPLRLYGEVRRAFGESWRQKEGDSFTRAYVRSLSQRLPLLYIVVAIDCFLLAWRFRHLAPIWLTVVCPLALSLVSLWRGMHWMPSRVKKRSLEKSRRDLAMMNWVGPVSAFLFGVWAMLLYPHGDEAAQSFTHYIVAITLFSGVLGLGHAPLTALRIAFAVSVPTTTQILFINHPNAVPVVMVQIFITGILLMLTSSHHRDFVRLELSRQQLERRERESTKLARENLLQATVDPLTGALNRRAILSRLDDELARGYTGTAAAWLALIDLDGFKHVNDTYGHAAGDAVLAAVASRLATIARVDSFGRLGGDEFALILDADLTEHDVRVAATDLSEALRAPVKHGSAILRLSGSIGVHRVAGRSSSDCLERADAALYKAKKQGDGAVVVFSADDEAELQTRAAITRKFNDSNLETHIKLLYQPIIDAETGRISGFEAFARWSPDGRNWLTPSHFIALAEATGRTGELTRMVLTRALSECRAWEQGRTLSINLAPRDVMRAGTADALAAIVEAAGAPAGSIILEVTERALIDDPKRADAQLAAFRARGFRIALDDFGAGWSSLSQVHRLPLDMIKIDRGLSRALSTDPGARTLVQTIVSLAWQLGIDCTIKGVEDEAQAQTAKALGVRLMQGYHFGRPGPAAEAMASLASAA